MQGSISLQLRDAVLCSWVLVIALSVAGLSINFFFFHYPGNNYFPGGSVKAGFALLAVYAALRFYLPGTHYLSEFSQSLFLVYAAMCSIALLTNAAQFTPFQPVDRWIIAFESFLGIDMNSLVAWAARYPAFKHLLEFIYDHLAIQMSVIPVLVAVSGQFSKIGEYIFFILMTAAIGFTVYYFFPTVAPATMLNGPYFNASQFATGIKFHEIHRHQEPSTLAGGMIALPSFHFIWAWLSLYLTRGLPVIFWVLLPFNILLGLSCVFLGWHYPSDLAAAVLLLCIVHYLRFKFIRTAII